MVQVGQMGCDLFDSQQVIIEENLMMEKTRAVIAP